MSFIPDLQLRDEFIKELAGYHASAEVVSMLDRHPLVILSGLAGGGRNTVINHLVNHYNYGFIVSDTTRPPKMRDGKMEVHGVNYYYLTEREVLDDLKEGRYLEAELIHNQQVSGINIKEVERIAGSGKIPITDCELGGANVVAKLKPDASIIALLPPSYEEWMSRLSGREEMSTKELKNRLFTAQRVLNNMLDQPFFKFVINDEVSNCAEQIRRIVEGAEDSDSDDAAKAIAGEILAKVDQKLVELA